MGLISSEKKIINDKNFNNFIQGKKIDFNDEAIFNENEPNKNQNQQNIIINNINNQNINYKPNISLSNKKIINRPYINAPPLTNINVPLKQKCTCSKTGCLKKYCYCFAKGIPCEDCECKNCENKGNKNNNNNNINVEEKALYPLINNQINNNNNQRCNCTKSNCMKKYCECFKQGLSCNSLCRCMACKNKNNDNNIIPNIQNNNLKEIKDFQEPFSPNIENIKDNNNIYNKMDFNSPYNYQTEAFGICIRKDKLNLEERNLPLNSIISGINSELNATPKFSKRKRLRGKNESGNLKTCPTTNSSIKKRTGLSSSINKNIEKKKLQLN